MHLLYKICLFILALNMACTTTYADDSTNCKRWEYRDTETNECALCPGAEYRTGAYYDYDEDGNYVDQNKSEAADIKDFNDIDIIEDLSTYFKDRPNAYPNENLEIQKVWFSPRNNEATSISECMLSYSIKNDRGIFVLDGVKYDDEVDESYNSENNNKIYYININAGYYGNDKYYDSCTENRYKYYMDAVVCPAGKYCTGLDYDNDNDTDLKCSAENYTYDKSFGINGDIAAGYYSTGRATTSTPLTKDDCGGDESEFSCGPCPVASCQATCQNGQNCTKCEDNETYHRTTYPPYYYADENLKLISAWVPSSSSRETGKTSITKCTISYEYENDRGIFNHESVSYNNETNRYDTGGGAVYYTKINAGYYGEINLWGSATACLNKIQYFRRAEPCPPGKYCNGRTDDENDKQYAMMDKCTDPNADWNQNEIKYIDGDIAAGYYSTGGAKTSTPSTTDCVGKNTFGKNTCGKTAPGYYSTGGGTLAEPVKTGNGCLSEYSCGLCGDGTYCEEGTQTNNENIKCPAGYYCPTGGKKEGCPTGTTSEIGSSQETDCYYAANKTQFCNKDGKCFSITKDISYTK